MRLRPQSAKEESEKAGLKLNIQKTKILASSPITSWQTDEEKVEAVVDFIFLDWCWSWSSSTLATWSEELAHLKRPGTGKDWSQKEKEAAEDEMVR